MTNSRTRGFPNLARAVDVGVAARAAARLWRSTFASLSALGEAKLSAHRTPRARADALAKLARELLGIHGVEVDTVGVLPERPCLLVANHVSHLDPLVILSQIPAVPVVRAEIAGWPVIGAAASALGARFAGDPTQRARCMRNVLAALRTGVPVLTFPEAVRGDGDRVARFGRGGFGLAILAGLPVVPIALTVEAAPDDGLWRLSSRARTRVKMVVRAPMWSRHGEAPEDFAGRVRTAIALSLDPPVVRVTPVRAVGGLLAAF